MTGTKPGRQAMKKEWESQTAGLESVDTTLTEEVFGGLERGAVQFSQRALDHQFLASTWWLTAVLNSSSKGSNPLF